MDDYSDIINVKRPISKHEKMSIQKRASIFNPFAALTGYEEAINEAGRIVDKKSELTDDQKYDLDTKINLLYDDLSRNVGIIYFVKDKTKDGGRYDYIKGLISKINKNESYIIINNTKILFDNLYQISLI